MITRRQCFAAGAAAALSPQLRAQSQWTREWDRTLIEAAVSAQDAAYDPQESMIRRKVGADYNYHSLLRNQPAHPTRDSLVYALDLLEAGGATRAERAAQVIERVLAIQDADPGSRWYGIWGYYLEEPPPRMSPADWNWADFNGSTLLLIAFRYRDRLPPALVPKLLTGIHHAAESVKRRNVTMSYTNIAIQGTFVTLAAAQLLDDPSLRTYATDRLHRFAAQVDASGSFNEYNSPTYANVSIVNLTRIRMTVRDTEALELADRIHSRAWLHLGRHWHVPTRQLAGPMSRCYSTDIGSPLWLQKSLGGRLEFLSREEIRSKRPAGEAEVAIHDYKCPESVAELFLKAAEPHQHRELFIGGSAPVQGTTWLDREFCLGSANRGNFWIQSRPLVAYWGGPERPANFIQLRFVKDDYDFSSALMYSVQERGYVLGLVNFRNPGGDKHVSLDPIQNGEFQASRLRLRVDVAGSVRRFDLAGSESRYALDLDGVKLWFGVPATMFGANRPKLTFAEEGNRLTVSLDLLAERKTQTIRYKELDQAFAVFTVAMESSAAPLKDFDARCRAMAFETVSPGFWRWKTPAGELALKGSTRVATVGEQDREFAGNVDGKPVPLVRLSQDRLS